MSTDEKLAYTAVETGDLSALPPKPQLGEAPPPYSPPVGQAVIIRNGQIQPDDYLGFALFVTICCCLCQPCILPCGIAGIVKASEVRTRLRLGDYKGAEEASQAAKMYSLIGMVVSITSTAILFFFVYVVLYVIVVPV